MRVLLAFARAYPGRSIVTLTCLIFATLAEGLSFSSLLPLLGMATRRDTGSEIAESTSTPLEQAVSDLLLTIGLQPDIGVLCITIVVGMILKAAFILFAHKQVGYTVAHVATDLRLSLLRSLLAARWEYYVRQPVGSFTNAFATEASRASEAYLYAVTIIAFGIQTILYIGLALSISWKATLGAAMFGILIIFSLNRLVRMARRAGARQTILLKGMLARLTDVLQAVKPLKAMAREEQTGPLLEKGTKNLRKALEREVLSKEALRAFQDPLLVSCLVGGLYIALTRLSLSLDTVIMLIIFFGRTLSSLNKSQRQFQRMASRESAYWSLHDTLEQSNSAREDRGGQLEPQLKRKVALSNICFSYEDKLILEQASCTIPAGQITLLVGPSGAGKTSTVDLIAGLLQPKKGTVTVDGIPLRDIDLKAWRHKIGYVPQEMLLLHETILANVTLGDTELTGNDVRNALEAAEAWDFVQKLPQGLSTKVGERGARLSGGQRQRIAIARALVHSPSLLILDEATTALDPASEASICSTVRRLRGSMTILAISHQPAMLEIADHIYELKEARLCPVDRSSSTYYVE